VAAPSPWIRFQRILGGVETLIEPKGIARKLRAKRGLTAGWIEP